MPSLNSKLVPGVTAGLYFELTKLGVFINSLNVPSISSLSVDLSSGLNSRLFFTVGGLFSNTQLYHIFISTFLVFLQVLFFYHDTLT